MISLGNVPTEVIMLGTVPVDKVMLGDTQLWPVGLPECDDGLVTNGCFDADSDWSLGTNWNISGGTLNSTGDNNDANSRQSITLPAGDYLWTFDIVSISEGDTLNVYDGAGGFGFLGSFGDGSIGPQEIRVTRKVGQDHVELVFYSNVFIGSIDNVKLVAFSGELVQNGSFDEGLDNQDYWNFGDGWEVIDNAASCDGSNDDTEDINQRLRMLNGHTYLVEMDVSGLNGLSYPCYLGRDNMFEITEEGRFSAEIEAITYNGAYFGIGSPTRETITVDNVSVTEVVACDGGLVLNACFADDSVWAGDGTVILIEDGVCKFNTVTNEAIYQDVETVGMTNMIFEYEIVSYVDGEPKMLLGGSLGGVLLLPSTVGKHAVEYNGLGNDGILYIYGGDFDQGGEWVLDNVSLKEADTFDSGFITNGDFNVDLSGWDADSGWRWKDGRAFFNNESGYLDMRQTITGVEGLDLTIECTIEHMYGGEARVYYNGVELYNANDAGIGTFKFDVTGGLDDYLQFTIASNGGAYYVDKVSVKERVAWDGGMIRDGDFALGTADEWDDESGGAGTTFDQHKAVIASNVGYSQYLMQHDIGVSDVAGVQYLIEFDISDYVSGEIGMCLGIWSSIDTGAEYLQGNQHVSTIHTTKDGNTDGFMIFGGVIGAHMTIDNITVTEITP